jgi:DNA-binding GntR family transcriptional regulator
MDHADTRDQTGGTPTLIDEEAVARAIEQDIIFGRLGPGEPLREESLAKQHNASRHHVRSALMILERAGTVVRERNKGARVRAYSAREVRQLYDVRELLTRQAALRIPLPVSPEALARMQKVQADYEAAVARRSLPEIHEQNDRFHMEFFGLCENPYLVELVKRCMDMTRVIRAANMADTERMEAARDEHRALIDLLSGSDPWALSELCVQHLRPSKEFYLNRLDEEAGETSRKRSR